MPSPCLGSKALALAFAVRRACGWDGDVGPRPRHSCCSLESFCWASCTSERRVLSWCGHTSANTPDPIRTPQLRALGPEQYWDGWPPGKSWCCTPFELPSLLARAIPLRLPTHTGFGLSASGRNMAWRCAWVRKRRGSNRGKRYIYIYICVLLV